MYFIYGEAELAYLRRKDKRLAAVIDRIGPVERTVDPDLFSAVVHHIIGQQISMKAQATIWQRRNDPCRRCARAAGPRHDVPQGGISHGPCRANCGWLIRSGDRPQYGRCVGHPRTEQPARHRRLDGGDDPAVLPAAAGYFQL